MPTTTATKCLLAIIVTCYVIRLWYIFDAKEEGEIMKFMSVREFRVNTGRTRRDLDRNEEVVLTANGRPFAIVSAVRPEVFDKELRAIRGARARVVLERVRESAALAGTSNMPMSEVNAIIADVRRAKSKS